MERRVLSSPGGEERALGASAHDQQREQRENPYQFGLAVPRISDAELESTQAEYLGSLEGLRARRE